MGPLFIHRRRAAGFAQRSGAMCVFQAGCGADSEGIWGRAVGDGRVEVRWVEGGQGRRTDRGVFENYENYRICVTWMASGGRPERKVEELISSTSIV